MVPACHSRSTAKPGQEIRLLVRLEDNPTVSTLTEAVGIHSNDGKSFSVVVTKEDGTQETHDVCYGDLLKVLSDLDET